MLDDSLMLDAQDRLILNNGVPINESTLSTKNLVKFLCLYKSPKSPNGIVYGISTQDILIKDSYLQMIEKIVCDRKDRVTKGCILIGSPDIGKLLKLIISHLMRITGFVGLPDRGNVTVILLINQQNRSHNPRKYCASIWTEKEIRDVQEWNEQVFIEYGDEPDISELIPQCDSSTLLKKRDRKYVPASTEKVRPNTDIMKVVQKKSLLK
ncbi:hypothetical protein C1646_769804 [Rhizophagus diaphanus]|nr:hypothetical protein C1646_769804 [Rhizophagus diaphanus] [Rhizophagus sp. MUCL 43196]